MSYPTLQDARITSGYGWRTHPVTGRKQSHHDGIDLAPRIAGTTGVPIYAVADGTVKEALFNKVSGNRVMIKHTTDKYTSVYCHLASYSVRTGQKVNKGQRIGTMGTTGSSTGIHLHFGLSAKYPVKWSSGTKLGSFINPTAYVNRLKEAKTVAKATTNRIQTGGLSNDNLIKVVDYFRERGWYGEITIHWKFGNPKVTSGGLTTKMQRDYEAWLKKQGFWYKVL